MNNNPAKHFGNSFNLNIDKLPCKAVDRHSLLSAFIFFILALTLISVGIYELLNGTRLSEAEFANIMKEQGYNAPVPLMSPTLFDAILIIIGVGLAFSMVLAAIRYKKIHFDGDFVRIIIRPALSSKIRITVPLYLYEGVQFRTEFVQLGLINRTKYIIELLHKDDRKTIPLYISTSGKNIRKIWEHYAKELRLPAIISSEAGTIVKDYQDLDIPLKDMILSGKLPRPEAINTPKPKTLSITQKDDKIIIKIKQLLLDAYNFIALFFLCGFAGLVSYAIKYHDDLSLYFAENALISFYVISALIIFYCLMLMTKRDKLIIKPDKVILMHRFAFFCIKAEEIYKNKIEEVDIICNPASGRSYIAIISDDKSIIMGKKMPLPDLRWLKQYIINELIK